MSDDFTPSMEQIRSHYVFDQSDRWDPERGEAFDRALAAHDAEVRASVLAEQGEPEWEYRYAEVYDDITYTYGPNGDPDRSFATEAAARAERVEETDAVVRRRKAGPWLPVEEHKPESTDGSEQ